MESSSSKQLYKINDDKNLSKYFDLNIKDLNENKDLKKQNISTIVNFAAETHVDNSIGNPESFIDSNILGVTKLLRFAIENNIENVIQSAHEEPNKYIYLSHEATSKTHLEHQDVNAPTMFCYQGNKSKCLSYSLAGAIKYLLITREAVDIGNIVQQLLNIKQQKHEIIEKVNNIMCQNGMFQCRKLNKKKRK